MKESLRAVPTKDLAKYEAFANEIDKKWHPRDKVCHARLMAAICETLTGGNVDWAVRLTALG